MTHLLKHLYILALFIATTALTITPTDSQANASGTAHNGNGDRTGSPIAIGTCANCHSSGSYGTVEAVISVVDMSGPVSSFVAGETYMITVEVTHTSGSPSAYGFQLSLLDSENNFIGTFSTPSSGSGVYNQSLWESTTPSASNTFTVLWDAPTAMTTVTIYATAAAVNGTGGTSGDNASVSASFSAELSIPAEWIFADGFE